MNMSEREGIMNGIQFSSEGPAIHHLLFVDDSLFLCKTGANQVSVIKSIFKMYGDATVQKIN